jgi:hypothetical protein
MSRLEQLTPLFAVVTLPAGILAALFFSLQAALAVFVVGWLLLVPASAVLFGADGPTDPEEVERWLDVAERVDSGSPDGSRAGGAADPEGEPIEKLRERYAAGEIDEVELERRLDALLDTEGIDRDDEAAIEDAIGRLDTEDGGTERDAELERD